MEAYRRDFNRLSEQSRGIFIHAEGMEEFRHEGPNAHATYPGEEIRNRGGRAMKL